MTRQAGQSLTEYVVIGVIVLGVCAMAVWFLGHSLGARYTSMVSYTKSPALTVTSPAKGAGGAGASVPTGSSVNVALSNGKTLSLPSYPTNLGSQIITVGANGATNVLSDNLMNTAKQLLASGKIDETQYNNLVALANQGHQIASIEKAVEDSIAHLPPGQKFSLDMPITWNGQQVTAGELYNRISYFYISDPDLEAKGYLNDKADAGSDIQQLIALYQISLDSGALSDPAVNSLVTDLSSKIATLGNDFSSAMNALNQGQLTPDNMNASVAASFTSHTDSSGICTAGASTDTGIHCTEQPKI
jgi:hypothetical protein